MLRKKVASALERLKGTQLKKHIDAKIFDNLLNPVMLIFIEKFLLKSPMSTNVPGFQSFFYVFASFCITTSSIRVNKA